MKKIIPFLLLAAACGDNKHPAAPADAAPLQAHTGVYEAVLGENQAADAELPDCGLVMEGVQFRLDVTVQPPHITVDQVPDDYYYSAEFRWSTGKDGVRYLVGEWALVDVTLGSIVTIAIADDNRDNAFGVATLTVVDLTSDDLGIVCAEKATVTGRFTPSK